MPLERSDAALDLSDPNVILGPHKRHPTERVLENGDPLACKRARQAKESTAVTVSNARTDKEVRTVRTLTAIPAPTHQPPLPTHQPPAPTHQPLPPTHQPQRAPNPRQATNDAEGSDDSTSEVIMVKDSGSDERSKGSDDADEGEETEEDDDGELGMCSITSPYVC